MSQNSVIRNTVREHYAAKAKSAAACCKPEEASSDCCGGGYTFEELALVPGGADLGLGCGNPTLVAELQPGEVVLDLGSGAGIDCFLAARRVGPEGRVIGVDMTDEMLERARENAARAGFDNVEFRKGLIEEIPLEDASVDVIISNCVVNLSPEKDRVFGEVFRVLKPGGRLAISDLVALRPFSEPERADARRYSECITGAETADRLLKGLRAVGFEEAAVESKSPAANQGWNGDATGFETDATGSAGAPPVYSAIIRGRKPL
ncbi:MAG: arsenite methyltransferase [Spirochaetota bacterium]